MVARKVDLLMGADNGAHAIRLHEAEIVDELVEAFAVERAAGMGVEALAGEEDAAGGAGWGSDGLSDSSDCASTWCAWLE